MHEPGLIDETEAHAVVRGPLGQGLYWVAKAFAVAGGLVFVALVAMSLISIVGRKLASAPVPGDIEIKQMGTAVAAAAMLAYCEMARHHLRVDFFTAKLSTKNKNRLDAMSHLLLAGVAMLLAWRTGVAAISLKEAGETSMVLSWPVWPAVAAMVPSLLLLAAAGAYNGVLHWSAATHTESQS
jgi:TRAP-type C4-dicarboxylate transport system permease small subunit